VVSTVSRLQIILINKLKNVLSITCKMEKYPKYIKYLQSYYYDYNCENKLHRNIKQFSVYLRLRSKQFCMVQKPFIIIYPSKLYKNNNRLLTYYANICTFSLNNLHVSLISITVHDYSHSHFFTYRQTGHL